MKKYFFSVQIGLFIFVVIMGGIFSAGLVSQVQAQGTTGQPCLDTNGNVGQYDATGKCVNGQPPPPPPVLVPRSVVPPPTTPSSSGTCQSGYTAEGPLCVPVNQFCASNPDSLACSGTALDIISRIINILLYLAGALAVLFLVIGGYFYITSRGNSEQATKAHKIITYALVGLVIVILAFAIINVVVNQLTK